MLDFINRPENDMYIGCNYLYYDTYGSYKYVILSIIDGTITYLISNEVI